MHVLKNASNDRIDKGGLLRVQTLCSLQFKHTPPPPTPHPFSLPLPNKAIPISTLCTTNPILIPDRKYIVSTWAYMYSIALVQLLYMYGINWGGGGVHVHSYQSPPNPNPVYMYQLPSTYKLQITSWKLMTFQPSHLECKLV